MRGRPSSGRKAVPKSLYATQVTFGWLHYRNVTSTAGGTGSSQDFTLDEFWPRFFSSTFENWQSEWLQLLV